MIRINLLPPEMHAAAERKLNPNYVVGGVAIALFAIIAADAAMQTSLRRNLREESQSLTNELERYKPIVAQVETLERAKAELQQRKSVIQSLETERLRYPYFMEDYLKLLPSNVWITSLSTTLSGDSTTLSVAMDVLALDHYAVADLVSNLETSQIFSDVTVGPISLSQAATGQSSISCRVTTTYRKAANNAASTKGS